MEAQREFRQDYKPANKAFSFNGGDKATVLEVKKPDIRISVNNKAYIIPYRDFIVTTKLNILNESVQV